jgi:hypothetical protein
MVRLLVCFVVVWRLIAARPDRFPSQSNLLQTSIKEGEPIKSKAGAAERLRA